MKRTILVISATLLLAAVLALPAMGYTIKTEASPYPFSNHAEARPQFTIGVGVPAHNNTFEDAVVTKAPRYSISSGKPYQYSISTGTPYKYSFVLGTPQVTQVPLTEAPEETAVEPPVEVTTTDNKTNESSVVEEPAAIEPMSMNITGMVYGDLNADGMMGENETGISDLVVLLEGAAAAETVTAEDGSFAFAALAPGEYMLSVQAVEGMEAVAPVNVTLADQDQVVNFGVIMVVAAPITPAEVATEAVSAVENVAEGVTETAKEAIA
ncbi:MAG: hypothetical protein A4E45_00200 [Methanosaeta sp. PtaB.Bin039]|nr:MAG: hypothetical protein A4E45_00200 [Methanosaeta sp. PtaB.Bin039]OPY45695.1 MAG: hypothetical protein A4E47_00881 [Methanosaeta sp. PtaU1.Bin028]HOT07356.1 SdrD B-like domain-containing protein [Methanotrichaceae archaeon]HQF17364.1 SdrD B-like domain-containing protein [Methanotrichaceae archaeon]HQI91981.1 SdrD B-like domain-containing protein [Methanotrichaceae archaeon]